MEDTQHITHSFLKKWHHTAFFQTRFQHQALGIFSWCLFYFANAAFTTIIAGFVIGPYLTHDVARSTVSGTADWSYAVAAVGIIVAICAPFLGATVDQLQRRKPWLAVFVAGMVITSFLLFFTKPNPHWIGWGLGLFMIGGICYELTQVVYNTMLYTIAPKGKVGRISGWGWGFGYFGGLCCLLLALLLIKLHWITHHNDLDIRSSVFIVVVWLLIFSTPLFLFTSDKKSTGIGLGRAFIDGVKAIKMNFTHLKRNRYIIFYLLTHLIYNDGLNTLLAFSAIYAAGTFHMSFPQIIILALLINVTAGIGAISFAWIDDWLGPKFSICFSLAGFGLCTAGLLIINSITAFWVIALIAGIFVGPIQASSRSYMARIVPDHLATQLFGMYALSGQVTSFIGPIFVGIITTVFASQRIGLICPVVMIFIGLIIMLFLPCASKVAEVTRHVFYSEPSSPLDGD